MDHVCDVCGHSGTTDPHKRVRYVRGLVLGVGEFNTEQGYFLEKGRRHQRALHGYGTVSGLAVSNAGTATEPEIRIDAGLAIDPLGREICVPEAYCAPLNEWLARQPAAEDASPPDRQTAYVVLCYRECPTDAVPIPVGPCHSLDKSSVASRLLDAFELKLLDAPPVQAEEDIVRALGDLLAAVRVGDGPGALTTPDELVDAIRALVPDASIPDDSLPSIPSIPGEILLDPLFAPEILDVAMRVWVTEVRPRINPDSGACLGGTDACVLLARIDFDTITLIDGTRQLSGDVDIDETNRPYLLHTRLLQEGWLALAPQALAEAAVLPPGGPAPSAMSVTISLAPRDGIILNDVELQVPVPGQPALLFRSGGRAAWAIALPEGLDPAIPARVRFHWFYRDAGGLPDPVQLTWAAELNVFADGDDMSVSPPPLQGVAKLAESVATGLDRRLQVTLFGDVQPAVSTPDGFASITILMDTDGATDAAGEFRLAMAEVVFTLGSGGGSV